MSGTTHKLSHIRWLKYFLIFLTSIYILSFTISHLLIFGFEVNQFYLVVQLTIAISIYFLSYKSLLIPEIFNLRGDINASNGLKKYQRSGLGQVKATYYRERLEKYMVETKPYLNPDVTIDQMAKELGIPRHHLTQVINESFNRNFFSFINFYRVNEVKRMMVDTDYSHLKLSALGLEAGFKSKTAFNTNFKKLTGLTPSEWKNQSEKNLESPP